MHQTLRSAVTVGLVVLATIMLTACGSLSKNIESDGTSAEQLVWPEPGDTTPMHDNGTWPSVDRLRLIQSGMTKNQVSDLIGPPHFSEGVWFVREWNYLFHFSTDRGDVVCQYKILFDKDSLARSFYWKPTSCADLAEGTMTPEEFTFRNRTLFEFDSARITDEGHDELRVLVGKVIENQGNIDRIEIVGHTDRLGRASYNQALSQERADAVKYYLTDQTGHAALMSAVGQGETEPLKTSCDNKLPYANEIACLAPNRRVEVQVHVTE